jgi:hypothetical protein
MFYKSDLTNIKYGSERPAHEDGIHRHGSGLQFLGFNCGNFLHFNAPLRSGFKLNRAVRNTRAEL